MATTFILGPCNLDELKQIQDKELGICNQCGHLQSFDSDGEAGTCEYCNEPFVWGVKALLKELTS